MGNMAATRLVGELNAANKSVGLEADSSRENSDPVGYLLNSAWLDHGYFELCSGSDLICLVYLNLARCSG